MMKKAKVKQLLAEIKQVSREIDHIILSGGRVLLNDPLTIKYHRLRSRIMALQKPKLPGTASK
jgi:hypothetical protein